MIRLICSYFIWHYTKALAEFVHVSRNFLWFFYHFFSIRELTRTLFAPWQRPKVERKGGPSLATFFEAFVTNVLMRIVGFFIRGFVIVFGLAVIVMVFICELIAFCGWLILPPAIIVLFISGVRLLLK